MFELLMITRQPVTGGMVDANQDGDLVVDLMAGAGGTEGSAFWADEPECRFQVRGSADRPVLLTIRIGDHGFAVWTDQVSKEFPVYVEIAGVVVTTIDDDRTYSQVASTLAVGIGRTRLQEIERAVEDSYPAAASRNRQLAGPTWLGLGRDMRTFGMSFRGVGAGSGPERLWDWIAPQWHGEPVSLAEADGQVVRYQFLVGRGVGPNVDIRRRLAEGVLPILETTLVDGGISYQAAAFVGLESHMPGNGRVAGTHFLHADGHSAGHMFTPEQQEEFDRLDAAGTDPDEETVLFLRIRATNTEPVPRYAFIKIPAPFADNQHEPITYRYQDGFGRYPNGQVFLTASIGEDPLGQEESATLVQPGATLTIDVRIPHRPIDPERAAALRQVDYDRAVGACREHWHDKINAASSIQVPEKRIQEMITAGLLHLDLVAYGQEPDGPLAATIGVYSPIGSESAPIIQFFDSIGRPDLAARSLQYFLDKQHDDGFMQNFGGYMLETQAALWSLGEHYRYGRDDGWLSSSFPAIAHAVEFLLRNRREQLANPNNAYGLLLGKTADPEDPYASYMLNGYAYLGLSRAAEMVASIDDALAKEWQLQADSLRRDLRAALDDSLAASPVVPLGDGRWGRTAPPWADQPGPLVLDRAGERWQTHGSMAGRDSMLGPLWLIFQEVLEPDDRLSTELLEYHAELFHHDNTAYSQPYYSPHLLPHLRRGEVKAFLAAYYTMVAGLADPETYSFWEHYFHASPHKTHEEAWFLMQTRWMLYLEEPDRLRLLPGVPRAWLSAGDRIALDGVRSYFGPIRFELTVDDTGDRFTILVELDEDRAPTQVEVRVPHPDGRRAIRTSAGSYDPHREQVRIDLDRGRAEAVIDF